MNLTSPPSRARFLLAARDLCFAYDDDHVFDGGEPTSFADLCL
jgi:hypothetical protein